MKCKVCGSESGKYPLCRVCNIKKEKGEIIKCDKCGNWHFANVSCSPSFNPIKNSTSTSYLYDSKKTLISQSEQSYYKVILDSLPNGYRAFPQVNLASFIAKNDDSPFHNELFRNVDFLITNTNYQPLFIIEINDQTHLNNDRKERDEKVQKICEEAGIPIVKFWTSYGINSDYIKKKINETIASLPVNRIHHFNDNKITTNSATKQNSTYHTNNKSTSSGCYVATCVYGSYDCPEVWILRRYRDCNLASSWHGRLFIKFYYFVSPKIVKLFGNYNWFHNMVKPFLNLFVSKLRIKGYSDTPYNDKEWI